MPQEPPLVTASEVARRAHVHPETVRRWVREGRIAAVKLPGGRSMRFRPEDVDDLLGVKAAS